MAEVTPHCIVMIVQEFNKYIAEPEQIEKFFDDIKKQEGTIDFSYLERHLKEYDSYWGDLRYVTLETYLDDQWILNNPSKQGKHKLECTNCKWQGAPDDLVSNSMVEETVDTIHNYTRCPRCKGDDFKEVWV